jgi:hypothetical protein
MMKEPFKVEKSPFNYREHLLSGTSKFVVGKTNKGSDFLLSTVSDLSDVLNKGKHAYVQVPTTVRRAPSLDILVHLANVL